MIFLGITTFTRWSIGKFFKGLRHQKSSSSSSSHKHIHYHEGNVVHSHDHVHDTGRTDMYASWSLLVWFIGWLELALSLGYPVKLANSARVKTSSQISAAITTLGIGAGRDMIRSIQIKYSLHKHNRNGRYL
jgi:hypothetical protein